MSQTLAGKEMRPEVLANVSRVLIALPSTGGSSASVRARYSREGISKGEAIALIPPPPPHSPRSPPSHYAFSSRLYRNTSGHAGWEV